MASLNKAQLIGNVGKDPEVRYLEGNQGSTSKVASFTLATTDRYKDRNGELRENTEWHSVTAFGSVTDVIEKYVRKGTQLYVEGKLRTQSWTDQQGQKKSRTEIVAQNIQLLGSRAQGEDGQARTQSSLIAGARSLSQQNQYQARQAAPAPSPALDINPGDESDDLPF